MSLLDALSFWNILGIPSTRIPISFSIFSWYILPALLSHVVFAVLAVRPRTRPILIFLFPIYCVLALRGAVSVDIARGVPDLKSIEINLVILLFVMSSHALHWSRSREPPVRFIRPRNATPSAFMDGFDLAFNLRGYGWNWSRGLHVPRDTRPSGRIAFAVYAIFSLIQHTFLMVAFGQAIESFSPETRFPSGATIFDNTLPFFLNHLRAFITSILATFTIYHSVQTPYGVCTLIGVFVFGQDPEQWPPGLDAPWRATSLADFWGRRWQQWFRHTFHYIGGTPCSLIFGRPGYIIGAFSVSAIVHHISISPDGDISMMFLTFGMMGVGILLERAFKQATGKRVEGWAGWIWTMCWFSVWGTLMVEEWVKAGMFGFPVPPVPGLPTLLEPLAFFGRWLRALA